MSTANRLHLLLLASLWLPLALSLHAAAPSWIWFPEAPQPNSRRLFRLHGEPPALRSAELLALADASAEIRPNGPPANSCSLAGICAPSGREPDAAQPDSCASSASSPPTAPSPSSATPPGAAPARTSLTGTAPPSTTRPGHSPPSSAPPSPHPGRTSET